jgi:adenylate cyclase
MKTKPTLRMTLTTILLALLLFTMGSFGFCFYRNARFTASDLSAQILDQTSRLIDVQINDLLHTANEQGRTNLSLVESGRFDAGNFPDLARYWLDIMKVHPRLTRLSIALESTGEWFYVHRPGGKLAVGELRLDPGTGKLGLAECWADDFPRKPFFSNADMSDRDPRRRPWYVAARQKGGQAWSETYVFFGTKGEVDVPGITCATPILAGDGSIVGVLGASFDVIELSTYLRGLKVAENGFAFVVECRKDGSRRVIAHKDPSILVRPVAGAGPGDDARTKNLELVPAEELADGRLPAFLRQIPANVNPTHLKGTERFGFDHEGVRYLGAYSCLSSPDTPDWLICILVPEDDFLARVYQSDRATFAIGIVILAVAILIGFYVSTQVARPLEQIARETEAIGRIELEAHPVAHSIVREVDRLGEAVEQTKTSLRSFRKYVPADLIRLVHTTGQEATLGGEARRLTVSFCDIANFTTLSEIISPEELVRHLGDYFGPLSADIMATGGTVDKYIGDAIMAYWGAPAPTEDHAIAACDAALRNQDSLEALRRRWRQEARPELFARVGIHTGDAIVGNIGSDARLNYTVMGDTVNLASRLEGLGKHYRTRILIGESTYREARSVVVARAVDRVTVKGKTEGMLIYELLGLKSEGRQDFEDLAGLSDRALELYGARDWEAALELFEEIDRVRPGDGPANVLADRCRAYLDSPPAEDWDGVHRMASK